MLKQEQHFKKTRIAPTPSGYLHLGNVLSFALTAALAKKTGAKILLRLDDLDQGRANLLYVQDIFDTLNFLNIPWDEGPRNVPEYQSTWSQMQRMDLYKNALLQLAQQNNVFACHCSRSQLHGNGYSGTCCDKHIPLDTANISWRLFTDNKALAVNTLNSGVIKTQLPDAMKDFVVKKKDGYPAYQLASLIDDSYFGVDLVVRGEDLYPSTIAQHYLADVLHRDYFHNTTFYHHPLLMESAEKKISKSAGATSVKYLREQGKTAADVYGEISKRIDTKKNLQSFEDFISLI